MDPRHGAGAITLKLEQGQRRFLKDCIVWDSTGFRDFPGIGEYVQVLLVTQIVTIAAAHHTSAKLNSTGI